jgi:hypothetical protein
VDGEGAYKTLSVNPIDRKLVGHTVTFYLVNEFGRVRAAETKRFEGGFNLYIVDLNFNESLPTFAPTPPPTPTPPPPPPPTPTPIAPALPVTGDTVVTTIPKLVLISGVVTFLGGILLLLLARRRREY